MGFSSTALYVLRLSNLSVRRYSVAGLFFFVGLRQMNRVVARDFALFVSHPESMYKDGHDNNWLLLEFLLGVPLAVGFKSEWSAGTTGQTHAK